MSLRDPILALHIVAACGALVLGPVAMTARKRRGRHTRAGGAYHWLVLTVCVTAGVLAVLDWSRLWWFLPLSAFSYANALLGYLAVRRRWRGWLQEHIAGMGGSYIAMVTATLVVNLGVDAGPVVWLGPTVVGTVLIAVASARVARGPLGGAMQRSRPAPRPAPRTLTR